MTLKEAGIILIDCDHKTPKAQDSGRPYVGIPQLKDCRITLDGARLISEEDFIHWRRKAKPQEHDVILSRRCNPGETGYVTGDLDIALGQNLVLLRADGETIYPPFLRWLTRGKYWWNQVDSFINVGAVFESLKCADIPKFEILVPSLEEQKLLTACMSSIDDKIALNTQTNQTLEQMAQAIFKSWFVDFDPVQAKMSGEQPEGMDATTASLFPEKLVESELGLIPEGWEVGTLDSHTSMIIDHRGKTPKKLGSDWVEEGYPAISAKNIKSKMIVRPDTIRFLDEVTYKKWMKEPLIKGDIIMTSEAPMGELYFFDGSRDFCLSQRLYGLRANSDVCNSVFLFDWLQTTQAKADMEGRASGSTVLGIKQSELRKVKILTPPKDILDKYSSIVSNLIDMTAKNNAQNISLEALRDTLLPKLLSGEIELGKE
ncbi:restriction endonuclease subunit S [Photobacterium phosphoreum]|uniref:restriction endonuclease subunit S n=1 Tax=Photobacterium phosphoreum TaxID=659 RepID=UPI002431934F|nr:restriction endonuclease subunit S [Photobacterium phosphoreum]